MGDDDDGDMDEMVAALRLAARDPALAATFVAELRAAGADAQAADDAAMSLANVMRVSDSEGDACVRGVYAAGALPAVLAALRAHPACVQLVQSCMFILCQLAAHSAAGARAAREAGAVEVTAACLHAHVADAGVVHAACAALISMHVTPGGDAEPRASERFAPALGAALATLRSAAVLQDTEAAKECFHLTKLLLLINPSFSKQLCDGGVVRATVAVMGAHSAIAAVQALGVVIIQRSLRAQPHTRADAAHDGALAAVLGAIRAHAAASRDVLRASCGTLVQLPRAGASHAARCGAVEPLCAALADPHWRSEPGTCGVMATVLRLWCEPEADAPGDGDEDDGAAAADGRRRALASGAAPALVGALTALRGDAVSAQDIAGALGALTAQASDAERKACGAAGVIEAVVTTLTAHAGTGAHLMLEQHCAYALANVCQTPPLRLRAAQAGALPALVRALGAHSRDHPNRTTACLAALGNIVSANNDTKRAAASAGAVEAVVGALKACMSDVAVTRAACAPLLNLTKELPPHQRRAVAAGALPALVIALRAHAASDAELGANAAMALANTVGGSHEHRVAAAAAGAIPALLAAMRAQPAQAALQEVCAIALGGVCVDVPAHKAAAGAAGALTILVAALVAHPSVPALQRHVPVSLGNIIAGDPGLVAQAGAAGAVEAVVASLRKGGASSVGAAEDALFGLGHLVGVPANAARAVAAGAFPGLVAAQRGAAASPAVAESAWDVAGLMVGMSTSSGDAAQAAVAAGLLPALVACCGTQLADAHRHEGVHRAGSLLLALLCERGGAVAAAAAVRAGALTLWPAPQQQVLRAPALRALQAAAAAHDAAAACGDAACARCAELRACGSLCGLPGCGAKARAGDNDAAAKKLLRCASCRAFAYCGAAHQRDDWARHKGECAVLKRQLAAAAAGGGATSAA
jgi:hypothetical protein